MLVRLEGSDRQCGPGMLNCVIYALSGLEAGNDFTAQLEPGLMGQSVGNVTKRFLERCVNHNYYEIKILRENFDDWYLPNSGVDLSNVNDEVKGGISHIRSTIKEFVFEELYVKFYNNCGEHIQRGQIE